MSKPKFCHTCTFYEKDIFTRTGDSFGICNNTSVATQVALDGKSHLEEEGTFYTAKYFGCIYWRENSGVLIDTSAIVEEVISKKMKELHPASDFEIVCKNCGCVNSISHDKCIRCNSQL